MIIKSHRLAATDLRSSFIRHVLDGADNDTVRLLMGGIDHIEQCIAAAKEREREAQYCIRAFTISPEIAIDDEGVLWITRELGAEFGFRPDHVTLVEHGKDRLKIGGIPHFHLLAAEVDPAHSQRILDCRSSYPRQEWISRRAEIHLGHPIVAGPFQSAVITRAKREGLTDMVEALQDCEPPRGPGEIPLTMPAPVAAQIKRTGLDAPTIRTEIVSAFHNAANGKEFIQMLARIGFAVVPGTRHPATPCIEIDGARIALHQIIRMSAARLRAFLSSGNVPAATPQPAPPEMETLPGETVIAEIRRQIRDLGTYEIDTARRDTLRASVTKAQKALSQNEEDMRRLQKVKGAVHREIESMGWWSRKVFRRRLYAERTARLKDLDNRIADRDRFRKEFTETLGPTTRDLRKEEERVDTRRHDAEQRADRARRRLHAMAATIVRRGLRFISLDELRLYLRDGDLGDEDPASEPTPQM